MESLRVGVDRWTSLPLLARIFIIVFIITVPVTGFVHLIEEWRLLTSPTRSSGRWGVGPGIGEGVELRANIELLEFDISKNEAALLLNLSLAQLPESYESVSFERLVLETEGRSWSIASPNLREGELGQEQEILSDYRISIPTRDFGLFPYDRHELRVKLWIEGTYKTHRGQLERRVIPVIPNVYINTYQYYIDIFGEGVDVYKERGAQHDQGTIDKGVLKIKIRQHLIPRTLYPVAIFLLLLFSVTVVAVKDLSGMLEVSVAILLGIWGVRQILVPDKLDTRLSYGVDQSLLIVYLTFAVSVLLWFIIRIRFRRVREHMASGTGEITVLDTASQPYYEPKSMKQPAEAYSDKGKILLERKKAPKKSDVRLSPIILIIALFFWVIKKVKRT